MTKSLKAKLECFFQQFPLLRFNKSDVILRGDESSSGIFYLKSGLVRQYAISKKGELLVIHIFRPGSYFLLMWAIGDIPNTFYFDALTQVEIRKVPLVQMKEFLKKEPEILFDFTSRLLLGLSGLLKRIEYLVFDSASVKVASLLSYFARTFGEKDGEDIIINLPLTHKEVASWIGTTRETASLQLEGYKRKGVIATRGRTLVVKDLKKLDIDASSESIACGRFIPLQSASGITGHH